MLVTPVHPADVPLLARPYYSDSAERNSPIVTSLAHVPEALDVTMPFIATVLGPSAIAVRTKELVILRASVLLECSYCVRTHSAVALDSDLSVGEVLALRRGEAGWRDAFPAEGDRALLGWVDAVAGAVGAVAPTASKALREHFSVPEVVELTLLCAATVMLNRYCTALELPASEATLRRLAAEGLG
jgi:AhpD family alkylhydroperoxidase